MLQRLFSSRSARTRRGTALLAAAAPGGIVAPPAIEMDDEQRYRPIDFTLVRRLVRELAPYRFQYVIGIAIGLIHVIADLQGPRFIKHIIDYCTGYATNAAIVPQRAAIVHILWTIAAWTAVFVVSVVFQRWCIIIMTRAGESVQFDIRRKLFNHLQTLSMSYYDKTKLGRIISRMTSDIGAMREVNVWGIWQIIANLMIMAVAAAMLMFASVKMFLAVAWLGPVMLIANRMFQKKAGAMHQVAREGWTRVSTNLAENITGMRVVTAFHRQDPNLYVFNRLQEDNTDNNVRVARINGVYQPTLQVLGYVGRSIILLYGGYLVASGAMTVGTIVAVYLYWDWFMNPVLQLGNFYNQLMQAMAGAERVFNLLDTPPD